ncbi:unnamed protein product [Phytomonas sp. Hart1]|nr:unnamed protein product [Phytomonas sp. Hart1]|eukprot:CCW70355.1 unnamed protein product [Phytomonas sp. isolate Hart1]
MNLSFLFVVLVVLVLASPASLHASSLEDGSNFTSSREFKGFRCQRPFSTMSSLKRIGDSEAHGNCDFHYFQIENASTRVHCEILTPPQSSGERVEEPLTCNVEFNIVARLAKDASERFEQSVGNLKRYPVMATSASAAQTGLLDSEDPWRYTFELRSTLERGTAITYKGYNSQGYSLCCSAIQEAKCEWVYREEDGLSVDSTESLDDVANEQITAQQVLSDCSLPLPDFGGGNGSTLSSTYSPLECGVFHIKVTRTLHRYILGPWEARLELWRQRASFAAEGKERDRTPSGIDPEVLGRVIVPFELPKVEEMEVKDAEAQSLLPVVISTATESNDGDL